MKLFGWMLAAAVVAFGGAAMAQTPPHWRNGDLICPDGSAGKPGYMPHPRPTAQDLQNACEMRAENKRLRDVVNRPVHSESLQDRQRDRDAINKLIGAPK